MADIEARTITGTYRGISANIADREKAQIVITNSRGNIEGWTMMLSADNARQLAGDLETLADIIDAREES